jgi:hypothetical protein
MSQETGNKDNSNVMCSEENPLGLADAERRFEPAGDTKFVLQPDGDVREILVVQESGFIPVSAYKDLVAQNEFNIGAIDGGVTDFHRGGYGLHISDAGRIARLQQDNERLIELLASCADFLQGQADTVDSVDGPIPNHAMQLLNQIDQELVGRKL